MITSAVVLAAVIAALALWLRGRAAPASATGATSAAPSQAHPRLIEPAPGESAAPAAASSSTPTETTPGRLDREARARMLEQLEAARARRRAAATEPSGVSRASETPPPEHDAQGALDKEYIRAQVRELVPMLVECYEGALGDDPRLGGTLLVEFTIGGEPEVGGLVETSDVLADRSTIAHPGMVECVRETMYAAQFDPPTHGGKVTVRYPFAFAPAGGAPGE